jgi:hypothetical protein
VCYLPNCWPREKLKLVAKFPRGSDFRIHRLTCYGG